MSPPPLLLALFLSALALSQGRVVSRCELRDELLKHVQLPRNLRRNPERALARVICEVERFSHLDTHFVREYSREIIDFGDATSAPTSTAPPPPPTTPPPRPPTFTNTSEEKPTTTIPTLYPERPEDTSVPPPPPTTPPPRPPPTPPEPLPPTTIPPTPYPEGPEPTTTTTTTTTTSTPAPPTTPPPRPPTTTTTNTTTTTDDTPPPTTDLIRGDDVGGANTSLARGRRSVREKRASISVVSVKYFGIFQFSDQKYCYSGYSDSEDRCKSDCFAFADDDISDDVQCFLQNSLFWDVFRGAQKSCRSKKTLDTFFQACDAGEEPGTEDSVVHFLSIRGGSYK